MKTLSKTIFYISLLVLIACDMNEVKNTKVNGPSMREDEEVQASFDDDDVMISEEPTTQSEKDVTIKTTQKRKTITSGTHKYRLVKKVSPDGEVQTVGKSSYNLFFLTFEDGGKSFYISEADGSRSKENGGYANRYCPSGWGRANNFANPTTFRQQSSSGEYITYTSKRSIANNMDGDDIIGYTTDYAKMIADRSRINLKIGDDEGYDPHYSSIQPLKSFNNQGWTMVLELDDIEEGSSSEFY